MKPQPSGLKLILQIISWNVLLRIWILFSAVCYGTQVYGKDISLDSADWNLLSYRSIPSHTISNSDGALKIAVKRSASPLVTMFPGKPSGRILEIEAKINGQLDLAKTPQGEKGADDFRLRVGLIFAGEAVIDPFQLSLAPPWIKKLSSLLPEGTGISHVQFWNTYLDPNLANLQRNHPTSELWREHFILKVEQDGRIRQQVEIEETAELLGVWISTDGDDTGSCFDVRIEKLRIF